VVRRNVHWIRTEGIGRFVEGHELHPVRRTAARIGRARWRDDHPVAAGEARPVFLFGIPRSGTNMLARALAASPEFEVHNDGDREAFHRHRLRSNDVIRAIVLRSRQRFVAFKPLLDDGRVHELLELGTPVAPKALWLYRDPDGRARSALRTFDAAARDALRAIAEGRGRHRWEIAGLSGKSLDLIRQVEWDRASPADGAMLLWFVRNARFFELGLDARADVLPLSYDALVRSPESTMQVVSAFLEAGGDPAMAAGIDGRSIGRDERLAIRPDIRARCDALAARLDAVARAAAGRYA
jgi:hypothetical protein